MPSKSYFSCTPAAPSESTTLHAVVQCAARPSRELATIDEGCADLWRASCLRLCRDTASNASKPFICARCRQPPACSSQPCHYDRTIACRCASQVKYTQQTFHDKISKILEEFPRMDDIHPFYGPSVATETTPLCWLPKGLHFTSALHLLCNNF